MDFSRAERVGKRTGPGRAACTMLRLASVPSDMVELGVGVRFICSAGWLGFGFLSRSF